MYNVLGNIKDTWIFSVKILTKPNKDSENNSYKSYMNLKGNIAGKELWWGSIWYPFKAASENF